jgi:hypothetical protein
MPRQDDQTVRHHQSGRRPKVVLATPSTTDDLDHFDPDALALTTDTFTIWR